MTPALGISFGMDLFDVSCFFGARWQFVKMFPVGILMTLANIPLLHRLSHRNTCTDPFFILTKQFMRTRYHGRRPNSPCLGPAECAE